MYRKIILKLKSDKKLDLKMSSLFHGLLMEKINTEYAAILHKNNFNPYSMYLEKKGEDWVWNVITLNEESYKYIINDVLYDLRNFKLYKQNIEIEIIDKKLIEVSNLDLVNIFLNEKEKKQYIKLKFLTPTGFKSDKKYKIFPDVHLIFQNIMKKYGTLENNEIFFDEENLIEIERNVEIISYKLKSVNFHLEGIKIPSFIGEITLKINGNKTINNFINYLIEFSQFSGIGIKTSIGMGAIKVEGGKLIGNKTTEVNISDINA
ncbi:CRISPR-associated endoribonuclease Cas6 [Fusobacterium hominis]|mgnify:CR=1 FL=1|uniref:CRISPR-associated endoribonuclease Cas6 n=1 Tax=Fusobacterium hominis TaxID=2764326 RepID=UPI00159FC7BF|nr:CRISPR-associated endoribonuclease Cas6 [Fusobacterium hominis]